MSRCPHRYLLGLPRGDRQVFLSWRLLPSDAPDTPFHVERRDGGSWTRVTEEPVSDGTSYLELAPAPTSQAYRVVGADGFRPSWSRSTRERPRACWRWTVPSIRRIG